MKFSGSGVFKHTYENPNQIPQFEERIVLLEAASIEAATKLILEEFAEYACEDIEFLNIYKVNELYDDGTLIIEVSSSMKVFSGSDQQYIKQFWLDQRPDSCSSAGWQHVWYNSGDGKSSCYNCNEEKIGNLWLSEEIKIRHAKIEDIDQLCNVRNNEILFKGYLEECDGEKAHFLVAEIEEKIAGFGLLYLDVTKNGKKKSHLPKLSDLYVIDTYRRKGIATKLIQAREDLARQYGYSQIYVSIDPQESVEMIVLAKKLSYIPLQPQPYLVSALYYDSQGRAYEKQYYRLDFKKNI